MKSLRLAIQIKTTEQNLFQMLFIMLYKVVITFDSVDKSFRVPIQMKTTEQYLFLVLFIMLYRVVLTFDFVDKILQSGDSNENYREVLFSGAVYYPV